MTRSLVFVFALVFTASSPVAAQQLQPQPSAAPAPPAAPAPEDPAARRAQLLEEARLLREQRDAREAAAVQAERQPSDGIPRFTVAGSVESLFYADSGYDLFDDEDDLSTRLGLWVGYDVARLSPSTTVAVELGFGAESLESTIWNGAIQTQLDALTLTAAVALRYSLFPWLDPQLRIAAGGSRLTFELETTNAGTFDDSALSPLGAVGVGLVFHTPPRVLENRHGNFATLSFGLLVEGGYAVRSAVEPELKSSTESNAIPLTRASLGELGLSGPYLRSSLLARF